MTDEKIFFQQGDVAVTSTRFITPTKTHVIAGITAFCAQEKKLDASWAVILMVAGTLILASESGRNFIPGLGAILLLSGLIWLAILFFNRTYVVRIEGASGKSNALESKNKDFILSIVAALNEAIVHRG
ncbi:DUF6232 family protein [Rikenella microfusus]|uniref:QacE-like protein n=1 Tax=Rikenella microfusus TaxID=28139 RepID=A0A379MR94_9BACT|nr:DUF6232 family protein [Rikenella microfusus]SUE33142.1 Uncharacterised protein [Rikenella microfusus]HJE87956.1 DUF6232 family protein [Rikenella microfusus]